MLNPFTTQMINIMDLTVQNFIAYLYYVPLQSPQEIACLYSGLLWSHHLLPESMVNRNCCVDSSFLMNELAARVNERFSSILKIVLLCPSMRGNGTPFTLGSWLRHFECQQVIRFKI